MTKEEALARLTSSRNAIEQAIEGLNDAELTQVQVEGEWTIKDILGHIEAWEGTVLEPLKNFQVGGLFAGEPIDDYMAWNDDQAALRRNLSFSAVREEYYRVRQELLVAAGALSAGQWTVSVPFPWRSQETIADGLYGLGDHELEHTQAIQDWRERGAR